MGVGVADALIIQASHVARLLHRGPGGPFACLSHSSRSASRSSSSRHVHPSTTPHLRATGAVLKYETRLTTSRAAPTMCAARALRSFSRVSVSAAGPEIPHAALRGHLQDRYSRQDDLEGRSRRVREAREGPLARVQQTRHVARLDDERIRDTDAHSRRGGCRGCRPGARRRSPMRSAAAPANIVDTSVARAAAPLRCLPTGPHEQSGNEPDGFRLIATDRSPAPIRTDLTRPLDCSCASRQPYGRNAERK